MPRWTEGLPFVGALIWLKRRLCLVLTVLFLSATSSRVAFAQDSVAVVLSEQALMRDVPTITGVVRAVLLRGDTVKVRRREGYWLLVEFATREGFLRLAQLTDLFVVGSSPSTPSSNQTMVAAVSPSAAATNVLAAETPNPPTKSGDKTAPRKAAPSPKPAAKKEKTTKSNETPADSQRVSYVPPAFGNPSMRFPGTSTASAAAPLDTGVGDAEETEAEPTRRPQFRIEAAYLRRNVSVGDALRDGAAVPPASLQPAGGASGNGIELQLRAKFRLLSLGAGYAMSSHPRADDLNEVWSGPFLEPRFDWPLLRSLDLSMGLRTGFLKGTVERDTTLGEVRGTTELVTRASQWMGVVGIRYHVGERLALEVGTGYGTVPVSKTEVRTVTRSSDQRIERRATTNVGKRGEIRQLRLGMTLGF